MKTKYILASISISLTLILSIILILILSYLKIINTTILIILSIIAIITNIIIIKLYLNKNKNKYNIGIFISFLLCIILVSTLYETNQKYDYLNIIINKNLTYETYNIYVLKKNTTYNSIEKLENKKIGILNNNKQNIKDYLENKINIECITYSSFTDISESIQNGDIQSFIISEKDYNKLNKEEKTIFTKTRIIYNAKIKNNI